MLMHRTVSELSLDALQSTHMYRLRTTPSNISWTGVLDGLQVMIS